MAKNNEHGKVVAENRKARHEYLVEDTLEAGLMLTGTEVKSLRTGRANIQESYASPENGEMWLINAHIPEYEQGNRYNHEPRRKRKLLVHRREIDKLQGVVKREGMTLVPLKLYFDQRGRAKLLLGIARGKKAHDKREADKERDWNRQKQRLMRQNY
jgi:SsrA-binding protein